MNRKTLSWLCVIAAVACLVKVSDAADGKPPAERRPSRFEIDIGHPAGPAGHRDASMLAAVLEKYFSVRKTGAPTAKIDLRLRALASEDEIFAREFQRVLGEAAAAIFLAPEVVANPRLRVIPVHLGRNRALLQKDGWSVERFDGTSVVFRSIDELFVHLRTAEDVWWCERKGTRPRAPSHTLEVRFVNGRAVAISYIGASPEKAGGVCTFRANHGDRDLRWQEVGPFETHFVRVADGKELDRVVVTTLSSAVNVTFEELDRNPQCGPHTRPAQSITILRRDKKCAVLEDDAKPTAR